MDEQQNKDVVKIPNQNNNPKYNDIKTKKQSPKKIQKVSKTATGKPKKTKKVIKTKKVVAVKNTQIPQQQVLPSEINYEKELPVQNLEQINKEYQLKDIINKTQTTYSYSKALSTTVVKPVIVQEVTTRKPIIAPVDIRTPVNFFEGQPLNSEDLIIQNFFKNTTPMVEATEKDYSSSYLFQGNNFLSQSVQYPTYQIEPNQQTYQQQHKNVNFLSQSVTFPSQKKNIGIVQSNFQTGNFTRPQVEKVQKKTVIIQDFDSQTAKETQRKIINPQIVRTQPKTQTKKVKVVKKIVKSKNITNQDSGKKSQDLAKSLKPHEKLENITVNNMLKSTYPVLIQKKKIEAQNHDDKTEEKIPRDSVRQKKINN